LLFSRVSIFVTSTISEEGSGLKPDANVFNNSQHCWPNNGGSCCVSLPIAKTLTSFKLYATPPTTRNQHTTGCANGRNHKIHRMRYDKRDDFAFRIVNFPHTDSNIPANPAYGVYISQLVRYARICTSKVDFINKLRGLSLRLRQQGFETNRLQNSFNKFVSRHGFIVEKYGAALREMRLAIQA